MRIAWITDSTTILPDTIAQRDDLSVVPLLVMKDGESFVDVSTLMRRPSIAGLTQNTR